MDVICAIGDVRDRVRAARDEGRRVGFVPTMGALHEGHLSLVRRAAGDGCFVAASIYVNPSQFAAGEDLARYPRTLESDLARCRAEGVGLVFVPSDETMYGAAHATWVEVGEVTAGLCGAWRPGHFRGVATIVAKLFNVVQPDVAYFGRKDFQQLVTIRRMAADLDMPVEVVGCPTVRDADGLALSSRNAYLSPAERARALAIPAVLREADGRWRGGERRPGGLVAGLRERLASAVDSIDYFGVYHPETLAPADEAAPPGGNPVVALAARVGRTRLIDNVQLGIDPPPSSAT